MMADNLNTTSYGYKPKVPEYVTLPSRIDGVSRALRKTFSQDDELPDELSALLDRLGRIDG